MQQFYQNEKDVDEHGAPRDLSKLDKLANKLFLPLKLACETRNIKLMVPALDCIQVCDTFFFFF